MCAEVTEKPGNSAINNRAGLPNNLRQFLDDFVESGYSIAELAAMILNPAYEKSKDAISVPKRRRERKIWEEREIQMLLIGVSICGVGNWALVHSAMRFSPRRSYTDLKDKWRNLLDSRTNARTSLKYKQIANYLLTQTGQISPDAAKRALSPGSITDQSIDIMFNELVEKSTGRSEPKIEKARIIRHRHDTWQIPPIHKL